MADSLKALEDYPDISFIDNITIDDLQAQMLSWYKEKYKAVTGKDAVMGKADECRLRLETDGYYIFLLLKKIDFTGKMNLLKYSVGNYLEELGANKKTSRKAAAASLTTIRYSLNAARTSATPIPSGSRTTAGDGVYFATTAYAEIPAGKTYIDVTAECSVEGKDGNNYSKGEINTMVDIIPFIDSVENITAPANGRDIETDDELKQRIYLAPNGYTNGGTDGAYAWEALQFDQTIADIKVFSDSPNVVNVVPLLNGGIIPGDEYIKDMQAYLSDHSRKMLTDKVSVEKPTAVNYTINAAYYINDSDKSKAETIQSLVDAAVQDYLTWQRGKLGRDINPDELITLMKNAGAKRVVVSQPVYMTTTQRQVAICSSTKVTYGGIEDD